MRGLRMEPSARTNCNFASATETECTNPSHLPSNQFDSRILLYTCWTFRSTAIFSFCPAIVAELQLGKFVLPALQSRTGTRTEICRRIHLRSDGWRTAPAKIGCTANLFLCAMFSFTGNGSLARGRAERSCVADDSRARQLRSCTHRRRLGESAGNRDSVIAKWRRACSAQCSWRLS